LEKTRLRAPFDGQVISSHLDPGEFVQAVQSSSMMGAGDVANAD
jgi:multidrug resistance efflux pump